MNKYAVLAEDKSDAEALAVLVKRIRGAGNISVKKKGYGGCGELCRKVGTQILDFQTQGITHFVICHDSDDNDPHMIREKVKQSIASHVDLSSCIFQIIVPIQEFEAWIIADEHAIEKVIPSLKIRQVPHPEQTRSPKEWLISQSRLGRSKPLYVPTIWNDKVAKYLDIDKVGLKCPSFKELVDFIRGK